MNAERRQEASMALVAMMGFLYEANAKLLSTLLNFCGYEAVTSRKEVRHLRAQILPLLTAVGRSTEKAVTVLELLGRYSFPAIQAAPKLLGKTPFEQAMFRKFQHGESIAVGNDLLRLFKPSLKLLGVIKDAFGAPGAMAVNDTVEHARLRTLLIELRREMQFNLHACELMRELALASLEQNPLAP